MPKVSVIMSVYNGDRYLREAVDSVLAQTFADFELIVINDGSTDHSRDILAGYDDARVRVFEQSNRGLVASLYRGIGLAQAPLIARHDADDRSVPERLARQVEFLEHHPRVVIVGSSMSVMDEAGKIMHEHRVLLHDPELRQELLVRSPFAHGSVMFRRSAFDAAGPYQQEFWPAEDYELWLRLALKGELANIDDCLYVYREHDSGISAQNLARQVEAVGRVQQKAWQYRQRLAGKDRIKLAPYRRLAHGRMRTERIIGNVTYASRRAWQHQDKRFALANARTLAANRTVYRRLPKAITGTIRGKASKRKA